MLKGTFGLGLTTGQAQKSFVPTCSHICGYLWIHFTECGVKWLAMQHEQAENGRQCLLGSGVANLHFLVLGYPTTDNCKKS